MRYDETFEDVVLNNLKSQGAKDCPNLLFEVGWAVFKGGHTDFDFLSRIMGLTPSAIRENLRRFNSSVAQYSQNVTRRELGEHDRLARIRQFYADAALREQRASLAMAHGDARRARELAAEGSHTGAEWLALMDVFGGLCGYCGKKPEKSMHREHRIPLVRGGSNYISNIIPACGPCNSRKHTMTETEFRSAGLRIRAA